MLGRFLPAGTAQVRASGVALGFGFLLLSTLQAGRLFSSIKLPRLTGFLVMGLICGPEVSGLLTRGMVNSLKLFNGVAVGLIALSAGCELDLPQLRPRIRTILTISLGSLAVGLLMITGTSMLLGDRLPMLVGLTGQQQWTVSVVLSVVLSSLSPAVAIALISETSSAGPVSETILGTVVLNNLVIVMLFAGVHAVASGIFGAHDTSNPLASVAVEVFGSMLAGVIIGGLVAVYFRRVKDHRAEFVLAFCFIVAEIGTRLRFDVLLTWLSAGLAMKNLFAVPSTEISVVLAPVVLPVFAVFFGVAGAQLHIHDLLLVWHFALLYMFVRAIVLFVGAVFGAKLAKADLSVTKYAAFGVLPQAGVSVGLAILIEQHFPSWGGKARGLILSVITLNELVGPVLLRFALVRSGEAGKRENTGEVVDH